jgi:hypothetical protein
MADFAPNYTARWRGLYRLGGIEHNMTLRFARGTTGDDIVGQANVVARNLFQSFAATRLWNDFAWIAGFYALTDTNEFLPAGALPDAVTGSLSMTGLNVNKRCLMWTFGGRSGSSKGRVVAQSIFGHPFADTNPPETKWYITGTEEAAVSAAIGALNAGALVGPNNQPLNFYNRVTIKHSDELLKKIRRGLIT